MEKEYGIKISIHDLVKVVDSIINFYLDHPVFCIFLSYFWPCTLEKHPSLYKYAKDLPKIGLGSVIILVFYKSLSDSNWREN